MSLVSHIQTLFVKRQKAKNVSLLLWEGTVSVSFNEIMQWAEAPVQNFGYLFFSFTLVILMIYFVRNREQVSRLLNIENAEVAELKKQLRTLESYAKELEDKVRTMEILVNTLLEKQLLKIYLKL